MVLCYREPEQLHRIAHYAFSDAKPDSPDFLLPSAGELRMMWQSRSRIAWSAGISLQSLAGLVRRQSEHGFDDAHSGVLHPEPVEISRRFDGRKLSVEEIGTVAVRVIRPETQVYLLDWAEKPVRGMLVASVPNTGASQASESQAADAFQNASILPNDVMAEVIRYSLAAYYSRATVNEFHD